MGAVLREMSLTRRFEHSDCGDDSWIWELGSRTRKGTGRKLWGLGILGGGDCKALSVDRSARSSTSPGSIVRLGMGVIRTIKGKENNMKRAEDDTRGERRGSRSDPERSQAVLGIESRWRLDS